MKRNRPNEPHVPFNELPDILREILTKWWLILRKLWGRLGFLASEAAVGGIATGVILGSQILTIWFHHAWLMAIAAICLVSGYKIITDIIAGHHRR